MKYPIGPMKNVFQAEKEIRIEKKKSILGRRKTASSEDPRGEEEKEEMRTYLFKGTLCFYRRSEKEKVRKRTHMN